MHNQFIAIFCILHESNCVLMFDVVSWFPSDHDRGSEIGISLNGLATDGDDVVFF